MILHMSVYEELPFFLDKRVYYQRQKKKQKIIFRRLKLDSGNMKYTLCANMRSHELYNISMFEKEKKKN